MKISYAKRIANNFTKMIKGLLRSEKREYLGHTLATTLLVMLLGGLSATFIDLRNEPLPEVLRGLAKFLPAIAIGFASVSFLVSLFVFVLQLNVRKASGFKYKVAEAFIKALDDSSFNPRRTNKDAPHEHQLNPKTV